MSRLSPHALLAMLSARFRARRFEFFARVCQLQPGMTVLDVGGVPWFPFFGGRTDLRVTALNLYPASGVAGLIPETHQYVQADARAIPFATDSFDVVFANSLLEHIEVADRARVAAEIVRVGRFVFVQVPYRYSPWEPHYHFPLAQFLPMPLRNLVSVYWPLSTLRGRETEYIELPGGAEMRALFPTLTLTRETFGPFTKALYLWGLTAATPAAPPDTGAR